MNSKKGFALTLIVVILAILGIGAVLFVTKNNKVEAPVVINPNLPVQDSTTTEVVKDWKTYTNTEYGFTMQFPDSWKGYSVVKSSWNGRLIDGITTYTGVTLIFKNPQSTTTQAWQDIPIMVITPDVWKLIEEEKVAVSAAPIGPGKVGENSNYVFATPPRWWGFTDALGGKEAADIVTTFKVISTSTATTTTPIIGGDKDSGPGDKDGSVACTMDAMMCPDGSYVGRSAPDCKFICPAADPANVKIGQSVTIQGIKIVPLEIVSDNRCPVGAMCITAGTVTLKTRLESNNISEEVNLTQFNSVVFANKEIKINNVMPLRELRKEIIPSNYTFECSVK